jgi:hypothetical protein
MSIPLPEEHKTPQAVLERKRKLEAALNNTPREEGDEEVEELELESPRKQPQEKTAPVLQSVDVVDTMFDRARHSVTLETDEGLKVTLGCLMCREGKSITLALAKDHVQLLPPVGSSYSMSTRRGWNARVLFAGGFFSFPKSGYSLLSFLIESEDDGEKSSSRSGEDPI